MRLEGETAAPRVWWDGRGGLIGIEVLTLPPRDNDIRHPEMRPGLSLSALPSPLNIHSTFKKLPY